MSGQLSHESLGETDETFQWKPWTGVVPQYLRWACFGWQFVKFTFIFYLCTRQRAVLNERNKIPRVLYGKLPPESFERARSYHKALNSLELFSCLYWTLHEVWIILFAGFTYFWFLSGPLLDRLNIWPQEWHRETGESIIFVLIMVLHVNLVHLPLHLWKTFGIEQKYGFNKLSVGMYFYDGIKQFIVEAVFSCFTGVCILWIVKGTGQWFFLWLWVFSCLWIMLTLAIYPNLIAPIFDLYTPLRSGRLKTRLKKLANFLGFPLGEVLVRHQNWRSEHRYAYFYGLLGSKRIVIYDTILAGYQEADDDTSVRRRDRIRMTIPKQTAYDKSVQSVPSTVLKKAHLSQFDLGDNEVLGASSEQPRMDSKGRETHHSRTNMYDTGFTEYEIEAYVARLMGNWVLGHSVKDLIVPVISVFIFFLIFSTVYENSSLFQAFEFPDGIDKPILLGLRLLYADVLDVYKIFVESIIKYVNRQHFYEADSFATKLGYGEDLIDAYIEAEKENLDYPYFDTLYWNYFNYDPSLLQAISAIEQEIERMDWKID